MTDHKNGNKQTREQDRKEKWEALKLKMVSKKQKLRNQKKATDRRRWSAIFLYKGKEEKTSAGIIINNIIGKSNKVQGVVGLKASRLRR